MNPLTSIHNIMVSEKIRHSVTVNRNENEIIVHIEKITNNLISLLQKCVPPKWLIVLNDKNESIVLRG